MYGNRGPRRFDRPSSGTAPVNVGDELDVKIEAVGEKGDGIAKKNGFVLFVPNVKEGDEVRIKVTRVLRKVGFADVVSGGAKKQSQPEEKDEETQEDEIPADVLAAKESDDFGDEGDKSVEEDDAELDDEMKKIDEELDDEEPADEPAEDEDEQKIKKVLDED
jgi:predicted RNA-binding protein with TRAM domain